MLAMHSNRYAVVEFVVKRPRLNKERPTRARDQLSSADPQIVSLIHGLQDEVRSERNGISRYREAAMPMDRLNRFSPKNEGELTCRDAKPGFERLVDDRWGDVWSSPIPPVKRLPRELG